MDSNYLDIPPFPEELLKALENRFPEKCPEINDSEREIFYNAGKVALIRWLRNVFEFKTKDQKDKNIVCV